MSFIFKCLSKFPFFALKATKAIIFLLCGSHAYAGISISESPSDDGAYYIYFSDSVWEPFEPYGDPTSTLTETYTSINNEVVVKEYNIVAGREEFLAMYKKPGIYSYLLRVCGQYSQMNGGCLEHNASVTVLAPLPPPSTPPAGHVDLKAFDIFYGDFNNDGINGDIYFHGRDVFVLIAGDISIPLYIDGPEGFVAYRTPYRGGYSSAYEYDASESELAQLQKASKGVDYFVADLNNDGNEDYYIRGLNDGYAVLTAMQTTNGYPQFGSDPLTWDNNFDPSNRNNSFQLVDFDQDSNLEVLQVVNFATPSGVFLPPTSQSSPVNITWGTVSAANSYLLEEKTASGKWQTVQNNSQLSFSLNKINNKYSYRVRACNQVACGLPSGEKSVIVAIPPSGTVFKPLPTEHNSSTLTVGYSAVTGSVTYYDLDKQKLGANSWDDVYQGSSSNDQQVTGLSDGYWRFRVNVCRVVSGYTACSGFTTSQEIEISTGGNDPSIAELPEQNIEAPGVPIMAAPTVSQADLDAFDAISAVEGAFRVNESGAATYSIPIKVVEGTASVTPQITLNYTSNGNNGPVGKGWSIGGIDAISRCRQTLLQDGKALPIAWSAGDRFCYNGQRLLVQGSATYGSPNSEYKTEVDSQIKIVAKGGSVGHPDYFEVYAKDGSKNVYGESGSSNSERSAYNSSGQQVSSRVFSWSKSRFEDNVGNAIVFEYAQSASSFNIKNIYFGAGASPNSFNYGGRVEFEYEVRSDVISAYIAGYRFTNNQRLARVNSYSSGEELLRYYDLSYDADTVPSYYYNATDNISRLFSVKECIPGGSCLPQTSFLWLRNNELFQNYAEAGFDANGNDFRGYQVLDINGDGKQDFAYLKVNLHDSVSVWISVTGGATEAVKAYNAIPDLYPVDINADGRADLITYDDSSQSWGLLVAQPDPETEDWKLVSSGVSLPFPVRSGSNNNFNLLFGDMDSDGLTDAVYFNHETNEVEIYWLKKKNSYDLGDSMIYEYKSPTKVTLDVYQNGENWDGFLEEIELGDFNGDGQLDLLAVAYERIFTPRFYEPRLAIQLFTQRADEAISFELTETLYVTEYLGFDHADTNPFGLRAVDLNGDGLSEVIAKIGGDNNKWHFNINTGDGFKGFEEIYSGSSFGENWLDGLDIRFADIDQDGAQDVYWRSDLQGTFSGTYLHDSILYKPWNPVSESFSPNKKLANFMGEGAALIDISGNGWLDAIEVDNGVMSVQQKPGSVDAINIVRSGLENRTQISYEPLTTSEHYTTLKGISFSSTTRVLCGTSPFNNAIEFCYSAVQYATDATKFYRAINDPFSGLQQRIDSSAPVMEVRGPMYIVAHAASSAPTVEDANQMNTLSYFYETGRIQAAGRGFLGFKKVATKDLQKGVTNETTYRQDWPYIGHPIETVTRSEAGMILNREISQNEIYNYGGLNQSAVSTQGTKTLGALQPFTKRSIATKYNLVDNGATQGEPISSVITTNTPDAWGNVDSMVVVTREGGRSVNSDGSLEAGSDNYAVYSFYSRKTIDNTYYSSEEGKFLGRLISATSTLERDPASVPEGADSVVTKTSEFTYYGLNGSCTGAAGLKGMLCDEIIREDGAVQLTTRHYYDQFGNETWSHSWGSQGEHRLSGYVEYDGNGRYPIRTYNVFNGALASQTVPPDETYTSTADSLGMSVQKKEEVLSRDNYGTVTHARSYVDSNSYTTQRSYTTAFGNQYFTASSDGSFTQSLGSEDVTNCPTGSRYTTSSVNAFGSESRTCFDKIGRKRRSLALGFDGSWIAIDTEYDTLNRPYRVSEPFPVSQQTASYWTTNSYDILDRVVYTELPFNQTNANGDDLGTAAFATLEYNGRSITTTSNSNDGTAISRTEAKNLLGELESVTEYESGVAVTARYYYDAEGNFVQLVDPTGNNVTVMEYGVLGQKTAMTDPDKGRWEYQYNAFGDLLCQIDAVGNVIKNSYDARGRLIERRDYTGGDCDSPTNRQSHAMWEYDVADNGFGQLSDEQDLDSGYGVVYSYDTLGRPVQTTTVIPADDSNDLTYHYSAQNYDEYGRPYQSFDAAREKFEFNRGAMQNEYNSRGYLARIRDAHNASSNGTIYYEVREMDERGNVTQAWLANGVTETGTSYNARTGFMERLTTSSVGLNTIQDLEMKWDHQGNLVSRSDYGKNLNGSMRNLEEKFTYDKLNRLNDYSVTNHSTNAVQDMYVRYKTDGTGNIHEKSDVGIYSYANYGPHAVSSAGGVAYHYNNNGSLTSDERGRTFTYTAFDKVSRIDKGSRRTEFFYGTSRARYKRIDHNFGTNPDKVTTTLYIGSVEKIYYPDNKVQWKRNIGGVAQITHTFNFDDSTHTTGTYDGEELVYLHKDHLGSINAITDQNGQMIEEVMFFDPWGARREVTTWRPMNGSSIAANYFVEQMPITTRGFTGHEMVDEMEIIHMNGRIYDAHLGRFLQADSIVQAPNLLASINRYSYVMNNPLNATDPSGHIANFVIGAVIGYMFQEAATAFDAPWLAVVGGIVSCAAAGSCEGLAGIAVASGYAFGATYSATGSLSDGVKSAVFTAFSAAAFSGIGDAFNGRTSGIFAKNGLAHIASHGLVGGVLAELQGGEFKHGFVSAAIVKAFTPGLSSMKGWEVGGKYMDQAIMAGVLGGTVSKITGGKFANGAFSAAMGNLFNAQESDSDKKDRKRGLQIIIARPKVTWAAGFELSFSQNTIVDISEDGVFYQNSFTSGYGAALPEFSIVGEVGVGWAEGYSPADRLAMYHGEGVDLNISVGEGLTVGGNAILTGYGTGNSYDVVDYNFTAFTVEMGFGVSPMPITGGIEGNITHHAGPVRPLSEVFRFE